MSSLRQILKAIYLWVLRASPAPVARWIKIFMMRMRFGPLRQRVPEFLVEELKWISEIEPSLYPTQKYLEALEVGILDSRDAVGRCYARAYAACAQEKWNIIVLLPDRELTDISESIIFINSLVKKAGQKVLALTTSCQNIQWREKLDLQFKIVDLGAFFQDLGVEDREIILVRLLLQLEFSEIYNGHSVLGELVWAKYGKALPQLGLLT